MVVVDEYQDCLIDQHNVVLAVSAAVPTAVLGDPLQGLFKFADNQPVNWGDDVLPSFPDIVVDSYPWRWHETNAPLGQWLVSIRDALRSGQSIGGCPEFRGTSVAVR